MICRTLAECAAAGEAAGAQAPPLTGEQVILIARLLGRDRARSEADAA
jgi:hypothetical protein